MAPCIGSRAQNRISAWLMAVQPLITVRSQASPFNLSTNSEPSTQFSFVAALLHG